MQCSLLHAGAAVLLIMFTFLPAHFSSSSNFVIIPYTYCRPRCSTVNYSVWCVCPFLQKESRELLAESRLSVQTLFFCTFCNGNNSIISSSTSLFFFMHVCGRQHTSCQKRGEMMTCLLVVHMKKKPLLHTTYYGYN